MDVRIPDEFRQLRIKEARERRTTFRRSKHAALRSNMRVRLAPLWYWAKQMLALAATIGIIIFLGQMSAARAAGTAGNEAPAVVFTDTGGIASLPLELVQPDSDEGNLYANLRVYIRTKHYVPIPDGSTHDAQGKCIVDIALKQYSVYCAGNMPNRKPMTDSRMLDTPKQVVDMVRNFSGRYFDIRLRQLRGQKPQYES